MVNFRTDNTQTGFDTAVDQEFFPVNFGQTAPNFARIPRLAQ